MNTTATDAQFATRVLAESVAHARRMLSSQRSLGNAQKYDFTPAFSEMTTQLFAVGAMWSFHEQFELPTKPRDRAFISLIAMLCEDGLGPKKAQQRASYLNGISRDANGNDNTVLLAGYNASEGDGTLAAIYEAFKNKPEVSGAPFRLLDKSKPIAGILAVASAAIAKLFDRSWAESLGLGFIVGITVLGVALSIYRQMVKPKNPST